MHAKFNKNNGVKKFKKHKINISLIFVNWCSILMALSIFTALKESLSDAQTYNSFNLSFSVCI